VRETNDVAILPGLVPLYGWAGAASDERLTFAEQTLLGAVPRHPNQMNVRGAFALRTHDESMIPRYEPGELVYLAPNQWPSREQDCVLVTVEGFGYLKRFIKRADGVITLHQLNPDKDLSFDVKQVAAMHAVVGRG
jgi:phage repressor protein C with HTH and peptisase S24 domain